MPTFESVAKGPGQVSPKREIELIGGTVCEVAYRTLSAHEESEAIAFGRQYAEGLKAPGDEDLVTLGVMSKRVSLSYVDPDNHAALFFKDAEQILRDERIGRDRLVYLNELQDVWQDQCNPSRLKLSEVEYHTLLRTIAGADSPDPFVDLRPGIQWSFTRTTAKALLSFLRLSVSSGGTPLESMPKSEGAP